MSKLIINGGRRLDGCVALQGAKNSALPILAAALATGAVSVIHNCPDLTDITAAVKILEYLGCRVKRENDTVIVDSSDANRSDIPEHLMHEMRSSIIFLGAMLSRFGMGRVTSPGGCEIGLRPIDLHLNAFRLLGADIKESSGELVCRAQRLRGGIVNLGFPSVGATENIMLASIFASGETVILNAAREPEIRDLADFLNKCGAEISGAGQSVIRIQPVRRLCSCEHTVIPDRIVASNYIACVAAARGRVCIKNVFQQDLMPVLAPFEEMGCAVSFRKGEMIAECKSRPKRVKLIRTMPYPGFPTDSQAIIMAAASVAEGTSVITEKIFENRFRHVPELIRMGADIRVEDGCVAVIEGVEQLCSANVSAGDLRGGCALVTAALAVNGRCEISNVFHIDRGFDSIEKKLTALGADVVRI